MLIMSTSCPEVDTNLDKINSILYFKLSLTLKQIAYEKETTFFLNLGDYRHRYACDYAGSANCGA